MRGTSETPPDTQTREDPLIESNALISLRKFKLATPTPRHAQPSETYSPTPQTMVSGDRPTESRALQVPRPPHHPRPATPTRKQPSHRRRTLLCQRNVGTAGASTKKVKPGGGGAQFLAAAAPETRKNPTTSSQIGSSIPISTSRPCQIVACALYPF